ncbi:MAG TPA: phosphoenolpyruvate carboxykinase domain-containing protein [Rectinemataceae bacterium]|nr:phosphoenolpyruvate carboxykinase domain-containing protein [Rectinemataceae bacterium]
MKLELNRGVDILADLGGVAAIAEARKLLEAKTDKANFDKLSTIKNPEAIIRIANAVALMEPSSLWINTGSASDMSLAREMAIATGEEFKLRLEGHSCHFDLPEDQGRMVDKTFYIVNEGEEVSAAANRMIRREATSYIDSYFRGIMKGKQMLLSFWNRGPVGAKAAIPAIMISDSWYVVHAGNLLYPSDFSSFDAEVKRAGVFFTNTHSMGRFSSEDIPKARIFMDRSWLTTFSMFCTYAGNTLMLKKGNHRFAVDLCTYFRVGSQLSEHMFITGLTGPKGRKTFFAGAAPSGCGKTTTAMVGTDFIGDDLAQIWIEDDGTMRAVNPEIGIFGIVEDVNQEGDPLLMDCLRGRKKTEVLWSNVLIDDAGVPHWTGHGEPTPAHGRNWLGDWTPGKLDACDKPIPMSNPNARITLSCRAMDNYNETAATDPAGCPISVITYSGRDPDTMPPVWVAKSPDHGVVIGASILSAATATEVTVAGAATAKTIKREPWANAPFTPGPVGDYMYAQFEFFNSSRLTKKPLMAGLNYFLTHGARGGEAGSKKLLGEKRDVKAWLTWLERRAHGEVGAIETPIGYIPRYEELKAVFSETIGKEYPKELYTKQFSFYIDNILSRLELQEAASEKDGNCPSRIFEVYAEQRAGLLALKAKHGPVVSPEQLAAEGCRK